MSDMRGARSVRVVLLEQFWPSRRADHFDEFCR